MGITPDLSDVIESVRYPLRDPTGAGLGAIVCRVRRDLTAVGCSVLPDFVTPGWRETLRAECAAVEPRAYYDVEIVNAYNTAPDPALPPGHPAHTTMERGNAFAPRDTMSDDLIVARLYADPYFQRFIAACVGLPQVHELADPLSGLCLNVLRPGRSHPWHFDTNEFTVSMLTQNSEGGGEFEYCPNIRSAGRENLDDVSVVLAGRGADLVRRRALHPGDLQLFLGRYSLHRVTTVEGATPRHCAIFAYSARPDVVGTVERTRQLFGRVAPAHLAGRDRPERVDHLMD